jgi:hypothetical protein
MKARRLFYCSLLILITLGCAGNQITPGQGDRGKGSRPCPCAAYVPGVISGPITRVFTESFAGDTEPGMTQGVHAPMTSPASTTRWAWPLAPRSSSDQHKG